MQPERDLLDLLAEIADDPVAAPEAVTALTLAQKFVQFHQGNPHIYNLLVRLAREWVARTGRSNLGIAALWERMRWELSVETTDEAPRLNNDHKAFYARLIMAQEADLAGLFDIRRSAADEWLAGAA